jgi:hypothetical protein
LTVRQTRRCEQTDDGKRDHAHRDVQQHRRTQKNIDGRRLGKVFGHRAALGAFVGAPIAEMACGGSTNGTL